jgi:capsular polysaccharide transport system permease protein
LATHATVIQALILRDLMSRFGRTQLGFIWTILEPMILCCGVMLMWSRIHAPLIHGIPVVAFIVTGYMPLTLWRHLTGPFGRLIRHNRHLLYHRPIACGDVVAARLLLEFLSTTAAFLVICFLLWGAGAMAGIVDPGLAMAGWLCAAWFYGALGVLICVGTEMWDLAEKFVQPANYLALPVSGVFFMTAWLPGWAQAAVQYNPALHCFEMIRGGFFGEGADARYDVPYLIAWCAALTLLGAIALRHVRGRIESL